MDPALKEELFESKLLNVPGFVEHLFPDSLIPVPFRVLESAVRKKHWDMQKQDWKEYSPTTFIANSQEPGVTETALATLLNGIGKTLIKSCRSFDKSSQPFSKRHWVSNSNKPTSGGFRTNRKPNICFVKEEQEATWSSALVTAELKSTASDANKAFNQLTNSAYMVFATQDNRRFHIGISICYTFVRVYVFDRAGVIGSNEFHLSEDSTLFIRLIAGLVLTDVDALGFDPSIHLHDDGTRSVTIAGFEYQILKTLFISDSIRGRGTVCWQARYDGTDYVIKNTWTDISRLKTEVDIMRMANDIDGVAHLVAEEVVQYNGKDDSTSIIRSIFPKLEDYYRKTWYDKLEIRVHRRLVTTPVADSLEIFKSKKELLSVVINAIEVHARLLDRGILHRDISMANIMMHRPPLPITSNQNSNSEPTNGSADNNATVDQVSSTSLSNSKQAKMSTRGILIDLDHALILHDEYGNEVESEADATGHRTGTIPFMAIDILSGLAPGEEHQAHHDIESFFYVLLWIMLQYAGPGGIERQDINIESLNSIKGWIQGNSIEEIGLNKALAMLTTPTLFEKLVITHFTPYFQDLAPCIEELRQMIFFTGRQGPNKPTHQDMIAILRKALTKLPDDEKWSQENDPAGYGLIGGKRKLKTFQEEDEPEEEQEEEEDIEASPSARRKIAKSVQSNLYSSKSAKI